MPKPLRLTGREAETLLLKSGYELIRSSGSHRIYFKEGRRIAIPLHAGGYLHPKIVKQVLKFLEDAE
ncbi:MAG: type II toxin-antitoxin system HicA family toxin [Candidatus Bathyarchaeia archaeon]